MPLTHPVIFGALTAPLDFPGFAERRWPPVTPSWLIPCHITEPIQTEEHEIMYWVSKYKQPRTGVYTVGEFMTRKEDLHAVKPTTSVDEALEALVVHRITGFPVIDDDWKLKLTALGKLSTNFRNLLNKTKGKLVGELMTPAPMVVRETTNLEDATRCYCLRQNFDVSLL